eukprot:360194-Chlamydomonas_euryale.AAC.5
MTRRSAAAARGEVRWGCFCRLLLLVNWPYTGASLPPPSACYPRQGNANLGRGNAGEEMRVRRAAGSAVASLPRRRVDRIRPVRHEAREAGPAPEEARVRVGRRGQDDAGGRVNKGARIRPAGAPSQGGAGPTPPVTYRNVWRAACGSPTRGLRREGAA